VSTGNDDVEETISSGSTKFGNDDLELTEDGSNNQIVGMRFVNIAIPKDALITNAYIEFETDETGSVPTSVTFYGEASDSAPAFEWCGSSTCFTLSTRPKTTASVAWNNIPAWNIVDEKHQSPDLSPIVQELVSRSGWASGNSMAFFVTGSGTRTAESFNGEALAAPLLHIEYSTGSPLAINASTSKPYQFFLPILFKK